MKILKCKIYPSHLHPSEGQNDGEIPSKKPPLKEVFLMGRGEYSP